MKPETKEWIAKAIADFSTAQREVKVVDNPNYDAVCFHAQQAAEKYLKAIIIESGRCVPRTHDLEVLVNLLTDQLSDLNQILHNARILSAMAVEVRYPGMSADEDDAVQSLKSTIIIFDAVREILQGSE